MNTRFAATLLFTSLIALAGCDGDDGSPGAAGATGAAGPAGPAGPAGTNGSSTSVDIVADTVTTDANDMRGLTFAQVGDNANKIYVSGHVGITDDTRQVVVGRFFADGSLDTSFGGDGFVELEATATEGSSDENSYGVAELLNGDVVAVVNALDADGGRSVYMFRLAPDGTQVPGWGYADGKV